MLTVSAKDLGPIVEGTVELRPLTVFVGPSNTGKSYLATLVYALMEVALRTSYPLHGRYFQPSEPLFGAVPKDESELSEAVRNAIIAWSQDVDTMSQAIKDSSGEFSDFRLDSLPLEIQDMAKDVLKRSLYLTFERFAGELQRCFGGVRDLQRRSDGEAQLRVDLKQDLPFLNLSVGAKSRSDTMELLEEEFDSSSPTIQLRTGGILSLASEVPRDFRPTPSAYDPVAMLLNTSVIGVFKDRPVSTYYLPAARSGIAHGHKIIAGTLVRQSPFAAIRPLEVPVFSGVIADFMGHLLTMGQAGREKLPEALQGATDFLEQRVIGGKVNLEESELPYPEIYYETAAGKFLLRQTSSMVSELAPLILFLKYLVRPGDLLILEEPESHLHPASQRRMAQGIVRLVNAGVRVLITTHSDYFVGQLNNLLQVGRASGRTRKRKGFEAVDGLKSEDIAAYHFHWDDAAGGSRVMPLHITPGFGIDAPDFAEVSVDLYEETISLQRIRGR